MGLLVICWDLKGVGGDGGLHAFVLHYFNCFQTVWPWTCTSLYSTHMLQPHLTFLGVQALNLSSTFPVIWTWGGWYMALRDAPKRREDLWRLHPRALCLRLWQIAFGLLFLGLFATYCLRCNFRKLHLVRHFIYPTTAGYGFYIYWLLFNCKVKCLAGTLNGSKLFSNHLLSYWEISNTIVHKNPLLYITSMWYWCYCSASLYTRLLG